MCMQKGVWFIKVGWLGFTIPTCIGQEEESLADDWRPSLKALLQIQWRDETGSKRTFQLAEKVDTRWKEFGALLDIPQNKLDSWGEHYRNKALKCWQKVMKCWLKRKPGDEYPATWEGLYSFLETLGCTGEAKQMKDAVESVKAMLQPSHASFSNIN